MAYSTGNGNGAFGLGWKLDVPGVSRKTSAGVPLYNEDARLLGRGERRDVFILSGFEDLVPVSGRYPGEVVYRPRTEGMFARITHHRVAGPTPHNYWRVENKDGLTSLYGSPDPSASVLTKTGDEHRIFAWKLTETRDPFGNRISFDYEADPGERGNQLLLSRVRYADYGDPGANRFLVHVDFAYEDRPDPFSDYRAGFEVRTTRRCSAIRVSTHTEDGTIHPVREYRFSYRADPNNGVSLLERMGLVCFDDAGNAFDDDSAGAHPRQLPPLTFGYTSFTPETRRFDVVEGTELPTRALNAADLELVDLHGCGLPDILEMNGTVRYWRNLGGNRFDMPRPMQAAPPHALADPDVQMIDANGDGRMDLLVTSGPQAGYYPLEYGATWSRKSFQPYAFVPSFSLEDPEARFVDLDGDGYTDILRSASRLEAYYNDPDPEKAWQRTRFASRQALRAFPNVSLSDPRVRLADMTGDGLQDIVLIHEGNVEFWPNMGHNRWGERRSIHRAPRLPYDYDPQRILLGDVDGDGLADIVYVANDRVLLWLNQSGNAWSEDPIVIEATPPVAGTDLVRLVDLNGTGVSGVLWSSEPTGLGHHRLMFLDFTGGVKPYVLSEMDNHSGAVTRVEYRPSTHYFLEDQTRPDSRWRTPLPFPVQVVSRVEVLDQISKGKLTTEYRYHHGYWDGAEREFRGFGMVEQLDTESFQDYHTATLRSDEAALESLSHRQFAPPTLTKTWFHQGPVGEEAGDWEEADFGDEYWEGDPHLLGHTDAANRFLAGYNDRADGTASPRVRRIKRDALRALRGLILRTEVYGLDDSDRRDLPYTVTEFSYGLAEIDRPPGDTDRRRVFSAHTTAQRVTEWERGDDPRTVFTLTDGYDAFGRPHRQTNVWMPRMARHQRPVTGTLVGTINPNESRVLATQILTDYAVPPTSGVYIHDRVAQVKTHEIAHPPHGPDASTDDPLAALGKQWNAARMVGELLADAANRKLIGHALHRYDGPDFEGLPVGQLGDRGGLVRSETLVFTDDLLDQAYVDRRPHYLDGAAPVPAGALAGFGAAIGYRKEAAVAGSYQAGYYVDTLRRRLSPRGLPLATQDALRSEAVIAYDEPYHLLPVQMTDPAGLVTGASYNYRLLQPETRTDRNGNRTHVLYNAIGLPHKKYVVGTDAAGGVTSGGTANKPEVTFLYDFLNFDRDERPVFVHTSRRVHHARDNISDETIESREYSDGFGRLIQTRVQAEQLVFGEMGDDVGLTSEPGSAPPAATGRREADRVVVSGWELFDNKGRVIEKYEPFFSSGWGFQPRDDARKGEHTALFHDPRGNRIRVLSADGSQQRVVFGWPDDPTALALTWTDLEESGVPMGFHPSPWEAYSYDPNDLAGLTHPSSAAAPGGHHNTPSSSVLDAMGRTVCSVARTGSAPGSDWFVTRSDFDIRGNLLTAWDAMGRAAVSNDFDLLDRPLAVDSIEAGTRTSVFDAVGSLIQYEDSKGSLVLRTYDELNRHKELWARNDHAQTLTLRERIEYGDEGDHTVARLHNTLGRPVRHFDEAGLLESLAYDFKGYLLAKARRTIEDSVLASGWIADWSAPGAEAALEGDQHRIDTTYDALNRATAITYPLDVEGERKRLVPRYNGAGALEAVDLAGDEYIRQIAYNARGQRVLTVYANGLMTRTTYDPHTFRLSRTRTERFAYTEDVTGNTQTWSGSGQVLQDVGYRYDPVGNVVRIDERTPHCGVAGSLDGRDRLLRQFAYDPVYRLLSATGRACKDIGVPRSLTDDPRCGSYAGGATAPDPASAPDLTESYAETFGYDPAGNLRELAYQAPSGTWTRRFGTGGLPADQWASAPNNRPTALTVAADSSAHSYQYDDNGNLLRRNLDKHHTWDHANRMVAYRVQAGSSPASISVQARYLYGADGTRVKKWVHNQHGHVRTTTYVEGVFERRRLRTGVGDTNSDGLHVRDDEDRIALVRVGPALEPADASPKVQYHLGDHLTSSHLVVGGASPSASAFVNREEHFPYGETSFGSYGKKQYRHAGKERDEESGLYDFGARYYAPWLGTWIGCDPAGLPGAKGIERRDAQSNRARRGPVLHASLYTYAKNNPITRRDPDGREDVPKKPEFTIYVLDQFGPTEQMADFKETLIASVENTKAKLVLLEDATTEETKATIAQAAPGDVLVLVGHANVKRKDMKTVVMATDDYPWTGPDEITGPEIAKEAADTPPSVLVLAGCNTTSLAKDILEAKVKVTITVQGSPGPADLEKATIQLVGALAKGETVKQAAEARITGFHRGTFMPEATNPEDLGKTITQLKASKPKGKAPAPAASGAN